MYRVKTLMFLHDIWHRGAILIIKRFKFLKRRGLLPGKWTFSGYHEKTKTENLLNEEQGITNDDYILKYIKLTQKAHNINPEIVKEGLEFDAMLTHLSNDLEMDELVDIRENSAYVAFVQLIGGYINYEEDGYEILAKEYKRELKYAGGNLMVLQLRDVIDRSIKEITDFFTSFPRFKQFEDCFSEAEIFRKKASSGTRTKADIREPHSTKEIPKHKHKPISRLNTITTNEVKFTKTGKIMSKYFIPFLIT